MTHKTRVLVTGAGGYIGTHLFHVLEGAGCEVYGLDNWSNSEPQDHILTCDIMEPSQLNEAFGRMDFEVVVHLAAKTNARELSKEVTVINVLGTKNVLAAAETAGVKRFVYASSAAVYDDGDSILTEGSPIARSELPYASSKFLGEWAAQGHSLSGDMTSVMLRIFNPIGGKTPKGSSIVSQILQHMNGTSALIIHGDGEQTRDFVHITDVCEAIYRAVCWTDIYEGFLIANVCTSVPTSINQIIDLFTKTSDRIVSPTYLPEDNGARSVFGSYTNAQKHLSWAPKRTIEEAVKNAYRNN